MRIVSGLLFFPRGGSAHVARAHALGLGDRGHEVTLVAGSRDAGPGDARRFFDGLDLHAVDFDAGAAPMHPSYEDRADAEDRCFGLVSAREGELHVAAWERALDAAGAASADVLHLHHLTPLHEAARRVAPGVPVVTHLHGTELLFCEAVVERPDRWPHGPLWLRRMRDWAAGSARVVVLAASQRERAARLLGISASRIAVVPNGVDLDHFAPAPIDRGAHWHHHLVEAPRGWAPGRPAGSVAYRAEDVAHLAVEPVVVAVGRFTAVKRVDVLIDAFTRARRRVGGRPSLVLVGGHPGEWEGRHPLDVIADLGAEDVFLAGWHDHEELPPFYRAADVSALASVREQFGLVLVEAMACGLPVVAVDRMGPSEIVEDGRTGWLVEPDDPVTLADALTGALGDRDERRRRAAAARADARARHGWTGAAGLLEDVLGRAAGRRLPPAVGAAA